MLLSTASKPETSVRRRTIRLHGMIGKCSILILVDSGANCSFADEKLAVDLHLQPQEMAPTQYVVAGGATMTSSQWIPKLCWWTQGYTFQQDVKVLPLGCYDLIVGADWLEEHSPMWVHWRHKTMCFTHDGHRITLTGIKEMGTRCKQISACKLHGLLRRGAIQHGVQVRAMHQEQDLLSMTEQNTLSGTVSSNTAMPAEVAELLVEFQDLFQVPTSLPPRRAQDHKIPLIPSAQPVSARPYRCTPQQKDEIQRQIKEMLRQGIIRLSTSPFASPVLLMRKKDGSWRFCVDYRMLNAITIKNKYPIPIVDELLDELAGAYWFTKLDMLSGYHQIRMAEGDDFKTAFRTHQGLYEFLVMPFGVAGGPSTFQGVVNFSFDGLLRKGVLLFMDDILVHSHTLEEHVQKLRAVFQILRQNQFVIKRSKCAFAQQKIEYLGHVIRAEGVATDPTKVAAVTSWPVPTNLKE
uniref:Reverse transcriptase domain-containing protein n=1 Tax=Triticum urartu TaxID=4572 RepID=A0A8R7PQE7_TRIUA